MRDASANEMTVEPELYSTTVFVFPETTSWANMLIARLRLSFLYFAILRNSYLA